MQKFFEWLEEQPDYGLCNPPITSEVALEFLHDYLLGEDFYDATPESAEQVNTAFVVEILHKYSKRFRKEYELYKKGVTSRGTGELDGWKH